MKYIYTYVLLLLSIYNTAQNLVPNPSFEYTSCPVTFSSINGCLPWTGTIGTPDYYNTCSSNTSSSVPKNFLDMNYQIPKTGNAYAGFEPFAIYGNNSRENLSEQLINNLINNSYYLVRFYVVNAQLYPSAHNNIALNFSSALTTTVSAGNTVNLPMHIYKFGNPIIADTLNWQEIMGIYKANGTEQYITIGNFKDDASTNIDFTRFGNSPPFAAYYMIDDVSVEPICTPFWSYRDTTLAIGQDSVLIGPAITGLNINWYDATNTLITNAPGIYVKPAQTTTYTAVEDFCGTTYTNTIVVTVQPTGLRDLSYLNEVVGVSPNPAHNELKLAIKNIKDTEQLMIKITDVLGKEVLIADYKEQLDISVLEKGVYFLSLYHDKQLIITKKIIKE